MSRVSLVFSFLVVWHSLSVPLAADSPETIVETSGVKVVLQVPSWSEVLAGEVVVVIDPDFLHLSGYRAKDGKRLWRKEFQKKAQGVHTLHLLDGRVLAWTGERMHVVEPGSGKIERSFRVPWNSLKDRCAFRLWGEACTFSCPCDFWLFDCVRGKQLGPLYHKSYVEEIDPDGSRSGGCYGPGGEVLGRAKDLIVVTLEDQEKRKKDPGLYSGPIMAAGLDASSGKPVWKCRDCGMGFWSSFSGISPDGETCFLSDFSGNLKVFSCQDGKLLYSRAVTPSKQPGKWTPFFVSWVVKPAGVFRFSQGKAELLDARTGKALWQKSFGPEVLAAPLGAKIKPFTLGPGPVQVRFLDPASGAERGKPLRVGQHGHVWSDGRGGYLAVDLPYSTYNQLGEKLAQIEVPQRTGNLYSGKSLFVFYQHNGAMIVDAKTLEVRGRLAGKIGVSDMSPDTPGGTLLVHGFSRQQNQVGQALLIRTE